MLKITLTKSPIGYNIKQKRTVKALGLGKMNSTSLKEDTPQIQGMVKKVIHLVSVETVEEQPAGGTK